MNDQEQDRLLRQHSLALEILAALISSILDDDEKARIRKNFSAMLQNDLNLSEETRAHFQETSGEDFEFTLKLVDKITGG